MAVRQITREAAKNLHPTRPILGIFKDIITNTFMAFDGSGNVEEISSKQFVNNGSTGTITVDTLYFNGEEFEESVTVNGIVGQIVVDVPSGTGLNSGSTFVFTVSNSSVVANSIIMLSKEGGALSNRSTISVNAKGSGTFQITGWVGWNITPTEDFKINFIVINP